MDPKEWEETLQRHRQAVTAKARETVERLHRDAPRMQAEMAERRERREMYGDPETRQPVMNEGRPQVREMHEKQRPAMDDATMALWNDWCDARCKAIVESALEGVADFLGEEMGKSDAKLNQIRKEHTDEIAKMKKEFKMRRTGARGNNIVDLPNPIVKRG